jgi:hypothetical protein
VSLKKLVGKFVVDTFVGNTFIAAGQQIGQAIGQRIAVRINPPPPPPPKKDTDADKG